MWKYFLAYLGLVAAQFASATNFIISKNLCNCIPVYVLLVTRFALSSILIGFIMWVFGIRIISPGHADRSLSAREWFLLIAQALFAGTIFNFFLVTGLMYTTATTAGIVSSALPVVLGCMSWLILKETLGFRKILAIVLTGVGMLALSIDSTAEITAAAPNNLLGIIVIFLSLLPLSLFSVLGKINQNVLTPIGTSLFISITNFIVCLPFFIYYAYGEPSAEFFQIETWLKLILMGCATTAFYICWLGGLKYTEASTAALFGGFMPVATSLGAILFLDEKLTRSDIVGVLLIILSVFIGAGAFSKYRRKLLHTK